MDGEYLLLIYPIMDTLGIVSWRTPYKFLGSFTTVHKNGLTIFESMYFFFFFFYLFLITFV